MHPHYPPLHHLSLVCRLKEHLISILFLHLPIQELHELLHVKFSIEFRNLLVNNLRVDIHDLIDLFHLILDERCEVLVCLPADLF